jgi:hypothetical protein
MELSHNQYSYSYSYSASYSASSSSSLHVTESIAFINPFQNGSFPGIAFIKWNHHFSHITPSIFLSTTSLDFVTADTHTGCSDTDTDAEADSDIDV